MTTMLSSTARLRVQYTLHAMLIIDGHVARHLFVEMTNKRFQSLVSITLN